jgi:hypothetical protein
VQNENIILLQREQHGRLGRVTVTVCAESKSSNFTAGAESKSINFTAVAASKSTNFTAIAASTSINFTAVAACTFPIGARCFLPLPTTRPATRRCRLRPGLPAFRSWPGLRYGFRFFNKILMFFWQSRVCCALIAN